MPVHPRATVGFGRAAHRYQRGRPAYPREALEWIRDEVGMSTGTQVVELGAGTGKFTRQLLGIGAEVVAVEPVAAMAAELSRSLPQVRVVARPAEGTGLPSGRARLVCAAQSFHWFVAEEAVAECHRLLTVEGSLAIIFNRREATVPLWAAVGEVIEPLRQGGPTHLGDGWRTTLDRSVDFHPSRQRRFDNPVAMSPRRLVDRVLSISFVAVQPPSVRREVRRDLLRAWDGVIGTGVRRAEVPYATDVFIARRR